MTATIEHHVHTEMVDDVLPVALMPEAGEQLAWFEQQLRTLPTDRRAIAEDEKQRYLDMLLGERPGQTLINEITYLSTIYDGRAVEQVFEDGTRLRSWGTRDTTNHYLSHRYYVQQGTDGRMRYRVMTLGDTGRMLYDIDDQGGCSVTAVPSARHARDLSPYRPRTVGEHEAGQAIRMLFDASMVSATKVRERSEQERANADLAALQLLANGPLEPRLASVSSTAEADQVFAQITAPRAIPFDLLFIRP